MTSRDKTPPSPNRDAETEGRRPSRRIIQRFFDHHHHAPEFLTPPPTTGAAGAATTPSLSFVSSSRFLTPPRRRSATRPTTRTATATIVDGNNNKKSNKNIETEELQARRPEYVPSFHPSRFATPRSGNRTRSTLLEDKTESKRAAAMASFRVLRILTAAAAVVVLLAVALVLPATPDRPGFVFVHGLTPSSPNPNRSSRSRRRSTTTTKKTTTGSDLSASNLSLDRVVGNNGLNNNNNYNRRRRPQQQQQQQQQNRKKQHRSSSASSSSTSVPSIFVKNLHYQATREDIVEACTKRYGPVESVWVPRGNDKKGYASVQFREAAAARKALSDGRLPVLGRKAYLVENTRPRDPQGDAFRFLAAFSRGDDRLEDRSDRKVREEVGAAGNPRSQKERGILAAAFARMGARDELLAILQGGGGGGGRNANKNHHHHHLNNNKNNNKNNKNALRQQPTTQSASTSVYNAALSALTVSTPRECSLLREVVRMAEDGPGVNARTYATAIASIKRGVSNSAAMAVDDLRDIAGLFLETARKRGVANHVVYNELISCLGKMPSDTDAAPASPTASRGTITDDASALSSSSSSSCSSWRMATDVLEKMFEDEAVEPTEVSLNAAINSCAGDGQIDAALAIYDTGFARAGIPPTMVTTNSILAVVHRWAKKNHKRHRIGGGHNPQAAASATATLDPADAERALGIADRVLRDAVARGDDPESDPITTNVLVSLYGSAGETGRALELFEAARDRGTATVVTANAALAALATSDEAGAADKAAALVRSLRGSDVASWNTALSACKQRSSSSSSSSGGDGEDSGRSGTLALELFREMPHRPDARTFVAVLSALSADENENETEKASSFSSSETVRDLLAEADAIGATTTFVLNAALAAYDRLGDPGSARSLLLDDEGGFVSRGLTPDTVSYNTVIRALGKTDPTAALEVFRSMAARAKKNDENGGVPAPDEQSYRSVLAALSDGGMPELALEVFEEECRGRSSSGGGGDHRRISVSPAVCAEALRACCAASDPERALNLLDEMKTTATAEGALSPSDDNIATTIVMTACTRSGRPEFLAAGRKIFDGLSEPDPVAFNAAIALAAAAGDPERAVSLLNRLIDSPSAGPDAVSYCSAIAACETSGCGSGGEEAPPDVATALRLLDESRKAVGPDPGCYIAAVQTLAAAGDLGTALSIVLGGDEDEDGDGDDALVRSFDDRSRYVLYRTVQVACAARGFGEGADRMSAIIREQNLTALAPLARASIGGTLREFDNHIELPRDDDDGAAAIGDAAVANTVRDLVDRTDHRFVTEALPLEFRSRSPIKTQEVSLANHAEKKALARLLLEEARNNNNNDADGAATTPPPPLSVAINFKMCADCHAFFGGVAKHLRRTITVREPAMVHTFDAETGTCSCGDRWRWESRHHHGTAAALLIPEPAAATTTTTTAATTTTTGHRFGRLPPRRVSP